MAVRPFSHDKNSEAAKRFFSHKAKGISKTKPTEGSKTQRRKANKAAHMKNTAGFK